jgi:transposase-like protein
MDDGLCAEEWGGASLAGIWGMANAPSPWTPPFCPNPACAYHVAAGASWRWVRDGHFRRARDPVRVQRFRCRHCRRHFSEQTFRTSYWLKRPELLVSVFHRLVGGSGLRQIAREFGCSPQTIATHAARLGRHCLLFHEQRRPRGTLAEPAALDTFVSFEFSQYHPTGFHLLAGRESHFFHGFTDSELRRSGTMTPRQRRVREQLEARHGRPDPRSTETEVAELLAIVLHGCRRAEIHSDEHHDYPRALARLPGVAITHRTISSRAARTSRNPLFPLNLLDLLIRHSSANHKRETIAFSKRRQCAAERLWVLLAWRNYVKSFSERRRDATPAMRLGLLDRRLGVPELLATRLFPGRIDLPRRWQRYYWRHVGTRRMPRATVHRRVYAM